MTNFIRLKKLLHKKVSLSEEPTEEEPEEKKVIRVLFKTLEDVTRVYFKVSKRVRIMQEVLKKYKITNEKNIFNNPQCVACLNNKPNILFCNCGHLCLCEECDEKNGECCPLCKENNNIKRKIII